MGIVQYLCPSCNSTLQSESQYAGNRIECPICHQEMVIPSPMTENPLPRMTFMEQAFLFKEQIIGPIGDATQVSLLEPLGFERHKDWMKECENGDWLEARVFFRDDDKYLLIYNQTRLYAWRKGWKALLARGEPSWRDED